MKGRRFLIAGLLIGLLGILLLAVSWVVWGNKYRRGQAHGKQLAELEKAVAAQGAKLGVLVAPYRQRRWKDEESGLERLRRKISGRFALAGIDSHGESLIDLRSIHDAIVEDDSLFRDPVHLSETGTLRFAEDVLRAIRSWVSEQGMDWPTRIVVTGDCYAEDLVTGLTLVDPETQYEAVRAYDDAYRAVELLFKFQDRYLAEPALVLWIRPEIFIAYQDPPVLSLEPTAATGDYEVLDREVVLRSGLEYDSTEWHLIQPKLRYPNAAAELAAEIDGKKVIIIDWTARNRKATGLEVLGAGDQIFAKLAPYEDFIATNDEAASAYYWRREEGDYTSPRYWILRWARSDYQGEKASSKAGVVD